MITAMTRYDFILLSGESESFLQKLQDLGVVDIRRSSKAVDSKSAEMAKKISDINSAVQALEAFDCSEDADAEAIKARAAEMKEVEGCAACNTALILAKLNELENSLKQTRKELDGCEAWGSFDPRTLEALAEAGVKLHFYSTKRSKFMPQWADEYALSIVKESKGTIMFVIAEQSSAEAAEWAFPLEELPAPSRSMTQISEQIKALEEEQSVLKAEMLWLKEHKLEHMRSKLASKTAELDVYLAAAGGTDAVEGYISVLEGYAPTTGDAALKQYLDSAGVLYVSAPANAADNPPIELKNNRYVRMFEVLTDMYGRPVYDSFDPTPFISVFFLLFFAMCMGDAGYGLVLMVMSFFIKKIKSFANLSPMVMALGIATVVVGTLFHTFFSLDMLDWAWVQDSGLAKIMVPKEIIGYDGTMVVAIVTGIIHLSLAMMVKTYYATKNNGFLKSLSTWGWTVFLVGTVIALAVGLAFNLDSSIVKWAVIALGCIGALGIFPLRDLKKNPFVNIGGGLWETYNTATGLLGDVLSYLRLYALGLAGSMLGVAFNSMALMVLGDGGIGWVFFILIALVGHVLNLAMAVLGAFVHPLRLNFLEFFKNSEYDGTGRNYNPLTTNNK